MNFNNYYAYIGTYTTGNSKGIYLCKFDAKSGKLINNSYTYNLVNPSYLTIDIHTRFLYAVIETDEFQGQAGGGVAAFQINNNSELKLINMQPTLGKSPCHLTLTKDGSFLIAANYSSGSFTIFRVNKNGSISAPINKICHEGSGQNKERQESPHVHFVKFTPDKKHLCVVDLGIDKLVIYDFDAKTGSLHYNNNLTFTLKPGSGPRHMTFHPMANFLYLVTELSSEIIVLKYDSISFNLEQIQTIKTLPKNYEGTSFAAAIKISPDGRYLYVSNRGDDSIAIYKIDSNTGKLNLLTYCPTYGIYPRDFSLTPDGKYLYAANQNSHNITVFKVNTDTGMLQKLSEEIKIPSPVCIKFIDDLDTLNGAKS